MEERLLSLKPGKIKIKEFEGNARYQNFESRDKMIFIVRTGSRIISTITINPNNVKIIGEREVSFNGDYQQEKVFYLKVNKEMLEMYHTLNTLLNRK